ncbi:MAG: nitronate monooxygenase [Gammaproteobacteria bacterium]|nr:nitronate monooxygenase [Gammaproteobacteria bacterium]
MQTPFTVLTGCRHPIQLAGMAGIATVELAAAVSNAGGLGMIGAPLLSPAALAADLDRLRSLTRAPFGVNFIVPFIDRECLEIAAQRAPVVEFFYGTPDVELVMAAAAGGALVSWQVGSQAEARAAVAAGVDFVVLQGVEGGGHIRSSTALADQLAATAAELDIPLLAAGGIHDTAGIMNALRQGAAGVRLGTVFVAAAESGAHPRYKEALVAASPEDAELTGTFCEMWPDAPHRALRSSIEAVKTLVDADLEGGVLGEARFGDATVPVMRYSAIAPTATTTGRVDAMAHYAGRSVGGVTAVRGAAEIMVALTAGLGDLPPV